MEQSKKKNEKRTVLIVVEAYIDPKSKNVMLCNLTFCILSTEKVKWVANTKYAQIL